MRLRIDVDPRYGFPGQIYPNSKNEWNTLAFIPNKDVLIVGTMMPLCHGGS